MSRSNGKFAQFISDRSGQAFPYKEMVIEWNGSRVHVSEFEPKHPQLEPKPAPADPQGLANARPQTFSAQTGDGGFMNVDLTLPAPFAFSSNRGMVPDNGSSVNRRRQATATLGNVNIVVTTVLITYIVTVPAGIGGGFYIDGVQKPTLSFTIGNTYRFDQSDASNGAHPLLFSETSNGTHGGGSEYTTGVTKVGSPGNAGAYIEIEITGSTTNPLYYYCQNHSGMGGQINIS